jgi:RNA polymerase sigma-70 factor (ECF subfamily)
VSDPQPSGRQELLVSSGDVPARSDCHLDPSVVAALYLEHGEELRRFLMGILRDAQLTSDVLQATFVKLVQRGHETRTQSRKAWLFRVAYHEAMAYRRRQGVGDKVLRTVAWHSTASQNGAAAAAEEPLLRLEAVQSVREALEHLPPDQRQVVRMRIYEDKTCAVIARELKIPLGTALGRMRAALIKLRARLGNPDTDEPDQSQSDESE